MSTKLHGVTSQKGKHVTAVRSSDLNHEQTTPSDLFTRTLTVKILTHTIRRLNLQSHIRFWPRYQGIVECHIE